MDIYDVTTFEFKMYFGDLFYNVTAPGMPMLNSGVLLIWWGQLELIL